MRDTTLERLARNRARALSLSAHAHVEKCTCCQDDLATAAEDAASPHATYILDCVAKRCREHFSGGT
jgi:hypothetical protein